MIKKNTFFIFNNVVSELYRCHTYSNLGQYFLPTLKLLVPFRYASIMRREEKDSRFRLVDPLCYPSEFLEAERNYIRFADDDYTSWLLCCRESTIFRESDLVEEQQRLRSTLYQKCYQRFDVYDSLQYAIVNNGKPLGVMSIFRGRDDGSFTDDELFLTSSLGLHLNQHMDELMTRMFHQGGDQAYDFASLAVKYGLTTRETQLLEMMTRFWSNQEIAAALNVRDTTLQKHYQNMFRKFNATSRWEIMRLITDKDSSPSR